MKRELTSNRKVAVFGAYGHTGKFVVAELLKRGLTPILSGRSNEKLADIGSQYHQLEIRVASIDDPNSLDHMVDGSMAVINCAGPFLDTATPLIEAALRNHIHYLDLTAEQHSVITTYEQFSKIALDKNLVILPAMAFYGGLADLLATAAMGDWMTAETIDVGIALDSWLPTVGTRLTGTRNTYRRMVYSHHQLEFISESPPAKKWNFSSPFGQQDVIAVPLSEIITISKHVKAENINTYLNLAPLQDLRNHHTPPPVATDESGRSSQIFLMEVEVQSNGRVRKASASGRDIYAITAPLVAEAIMRISEGSIKKTGVVSPGEIFDAADFLTSLSPEYLTFSVLEN